MRACQRRPRRSGVSIRTQSFDDQRHLTTHSRPTISTPHVVHSHNSCELRYGGRSERVLSQRWPNRCARASSFARFSVSNIPPLPNWRYETHLLHVVYRTSSHQYRNLITLLARTGKYRLIAPDLPGFGFTEVPESRKYEYSFVNIGKTLEAFVDALKLTKFALYVFD